MRLLKHRTLFVILIIIVVLIVRHFLCLSDSFFVPSYNYENISGILDKDVLDANDYDLIFKQTGVAPLAVSELLDSYRLNDLKAINKLYFSKPQVKKEYIFFPFTCEENVLIQKAPLVPLKDGDILVTFNTHTLDWRHGHAAIVIDASENIILEHNSIGNVSKLTTLRNWHRYPAFMVLRYNDEKVATKAAKYAENTLVGIDYNIFTGLIKKDKSDEKIPSGSHCSHIVWQSYKSVGVDIDFDGGPIVTPFDIASSNNLSLVQVFGIDPSKFNFNILK